MPRARARHRRRCQSSQDTSFGVSRPRARDERPRACAVVFQLPYTAGRLKPKQARVKLRERQPSSG